MNDGAEGIIAGPLPPSRWLTLRALRALEASA